MAFGIVLFILNLSLPQNNWKLWGSSVNLSGINSQCSLFNFPKIVSRSKTKLLSVNAGFAIHLIINIRRPMLVFYWFGVLSFSTQVTVFHSVSSNKQY